MVLIWHQINRKPSWLPVEKSPHSKLYAPVLAHLVAMRRAARLTTRKLSEKLKCKNSLVTRIELGERRLDCLEFYRVCKACGVSPEKAAAELMRDIQALDGAPTLGSTKKKRKSK